MVPLLRTLTVSVGEHLHTDTNYKALKGLTHGYSFNELIFLYTPHIGLHPLSE